MEKPERRVMVYGDGDKVIVPFACVDDGGLASCDDPRGKRFELVDERGLHAVIEVDARAGYEYRPAWKKGSQYRGLIWIEGYTADGLHSEGFANIDDGRVSALSYLNARFVWRTHLHAKAICTAEELAVAGDIVSTSQGERNEEAFRTFPRWQEYFAWERAQAEALPDAQAPAQLDVPQSAQTPASDGEGGGVDGIPVG